MPNMPGCQGFVDRTRDLGAQGIFGDGRGALHHELDELAAEQDTSPGHATHTDGDGPFIPRLLHLDAALDRVLHRPFVLRVLDTVDLGVGNESRPDEDAVHPDINRSRERPPPGPKRADQHAKKGNAAGQGRSPRHIRPEIVRRLSHREALSDSERDHHGQPQQNADGSPRIRGGELELPCGHGVIGRARGLRVGLSVKHAGSAAARTPAAARHSGKLASEAR